MPLIIEDGSGVDDSDSYVTELELSAYASKRNTMVSGDTYYLLIAAMDYVESLDISDIAGQLQQIKKLQIIVALEIDKGFDPFASVERAVKSTKTDVLETVYMDNASSIATNTAIAAAMSKITISGSSGNNFTVSRG